jgi:hypothetical protein
MKFLEQNGEKDTSLYEYFKYVKSLKFNEMPDYDYLCSLLEEEANGDVQM